MKRYIITTLLCLLLITTISLSWYFSSKTRIQSNDTSMKIAGHIENLLEKEFVINRSDTFWRVTFNELFRKTAHFLEYALIGSILCAALNTALGRVWIAALVSIGVCPVLACIDEYHQRFVAGRTPKMFDVKIDCSGALMGIIFMTIFFIFFNHINILKQRIRELEE